MLQVVKEKKKGGKNKQQGDVRKMGEEKCYWFGLLSEIFTACFA